MFVKQWEEKTTVSFQCISLEITKKYICPLKIADTSFKVCTNFRKCTITNFQEAAFHILRSCFRHKRF